MKTMKKVNNQCETQKLPTYMDVLSEVQKLRDNKVNKHIHLVNLTSDKLAYIIIKDLINGLKDIGENYVSSVVEYTIHLSGRDVERVIKLSREDIDTCNYITNCILVFAIRKIKSKLHYEMKWPHNNIIVSEDGLYITLKCSLQTDHY